MSTTTNRATTVDRLLSAIVAGDGSTVADLFEQDAILDATCPGWRFTKRGAAAIAGQFTPWFADAGRFEELERQPTPDGEVVRYLLTWEEGGIPHAAHHCHMLRVNSSTGLIGEDHFFCGGRWPASLLAEMAEADRAG